RRRADDAVDGEPDVALELADRAVRLRPQDAVLASGVEAQQVQPALEHADVVAARERRAEVQDAVAEGIPCLDELLPGDGVDAAVDQDVARLLERPDRSLRGGAELARTVWVRSVAERREAGLGVADVHAP